MGAIVKGSKREEVKDGESIVEACERLGVPFGCYVGSCGTCRIEVEEGIENLSDKTAAELAFGLGENQRLACQCDLKKGEVKIKDPETD